MPANTRIRIEADIEVYLRSQSERVLGKPEDKVSGAELTTIANRLLYEHKLAQNMAKRVPFTRLFNWLMSWVPGSKIMSLSSGGNEPASLQPPSANDDFDFDAEYALQFEDDEQKVA